jgi:hypothetical protein
VKEVGPTALVLEVYFNEARGTKALLISGTADVDGVPVNVFPTSQRPETVTDAGFPVPQTVRVLLNDSRAGVPLQLTVIGLNADGDAVEAATQVVTPVAQRETLVPITLRPFTDSMDPDAGVTDGGQVDGGLRFDAGLPCQCPTGCCDQTGRCAAPVRVEFGSRVTLTVVLRGPTNQYCNDLCPPGRATGFTNGVCLCGATAACSEGLRCDSNRCVCDTRSGCRGCCSDNATCATGRTNLSCGSAGTACARCEGLMNTCLTTTGRCSTAMCPSTGSDPTKCCSGSGLVSAGWPTCTSFSGDCVACDPVRSNACRAASVGGTGSPCACGITGQCPSTQYCLLINGQAVCREPGR